MGRHNLLPFTNTVPSPLLFNFEILADVQAGPITVVDDWGTQLSYGARAVTLDVKSFHRSQSCQSRLRCCSGNTKEFWIWNGSIELTTEVYDIGVVDVGSAAVTAIVDADSSFGDGAAA